MLGPQPSLGAIAHVPTAVPNKPCHTYRPYHNANQRQITIIGTTKRTVMSWCALLATGIAIATVASIPTTTTTTTVSNRTRIDPPTRPQRSSSGHEMGSVN